MIKRVYLVLATLAATLAAASLHPQSAKAQPPLGTMCAARADTSDFDNGSSFGSSVQTVPDLGVATCNIGSLALGSYREIGSGGPDALRVINNVNNNDRGFEAGISVASGGNVTNFFRDGAPYTAGTRIPLTTDDAFNGTFRFDFNGQTFEFDLDKDAGSNEILAFKIRAADTTAPQVTSIERLNPMISPTADDELTWRVTFNEAVQNVDAADFSIAGATGTMTSVTPVAASPDSTYDVTVSGGDLANLNATVTLSFDGLQNIQDLSGNALSNTEPTDTDHSTFDVENDVTAPTVAITAPDEVRGPFTVTITFSEDVTGFDLDDITVGNGAASNFAAASASVYTATITPATHGEVTIDVAAAVAKDGAGNPNLAAAQVVVTFIDEAYVRERTQRVISNFMSRRADQITANDPDLTNRLNGGANGTGGPVNFTAEGTLDDAQMAFATSLRQIVGAGEAARRNRAAELGKVMALGQTGLGDAIPSPDEEGFDLWVEGKWAHVDDETRDSELGLLYVGIDYRFHRDLVVGVLTQFDWTDETDSLVAASADGFGWMVGPYMAARIMSQLVFDGRVTFGQSDNDVNPFGTYTDSFDGNRWLIRGQLTGQFAHAGIAIAPHVRVIYYEERQESYTDSLGIFIPGQTVSLGRLTFGPKFSVHHEMSDGTVVAPHLALTGIWDFDEAEIVNVVTGLAAGSSEELRGKVEGGLAVYFAGGWRIDGKGFYDGIGAGDLDVYGGSLTCTVPLN